MLTHRDNLHNRLLLAVATARSLRATARLLRVSAYAARMSAEVSRAAQRIKARRS